MKLTITPTGNIVSVVRGDVTFPAMIWTGFDERGNSVRVGMLFFDISIDGELSSLVEDKRLKADKRFKEIHLMTPLT